MVEESHDSNGATPDEVAAPTEVTLADILAEQQAHRAEVASLRTELAAAKSKPVPQSQLANAPSAEDALAARMEEVSKYDYYCPGCGKLYKREVECTGTATAPHPPIEVVSTDELHSGDATQHTAAPVIVS